MPKSKTKKLREASQKFRRNNLALYNQLVIQCVLLARKIKKDGSN